MPSVEISIRDCHKKALWKELINILKYDENKDNKMKKIVLKREDKKSQELNQMKKKDKSS